MNDMRRGSPRRIDQKLGQRYHSLEQAILQRPEFGGPARLPFARKTQRLGESDDIRNVFRTGAHTAFLAATGQQRGQLQPFADVQQADPFGPS
ncbi:hypothetical protein HMSSN036_46350 [Paenibacillus macerans]|nr:hypothetical protein HMSSN036_46350 [Paenibacillus macerans]